MANLELIHANSIGGNTGGAFIGLNQRELRLLQVNLDNFAYRTVYTGDSSIEFLPYQLVGKVVAYQGCDG